MITLPYTSTITLHKDGSKSIKHTAFVSGEIGQAFSEAITELKGGSIEEFVKEKE
jgi:hypothetical protein